MINCPFDGLDFCSFKDLLKHLKKCWKASKKQLHFCSNNISHVFADEKAKDTHEKTCLDSNNIRNIDELLRKKFFVYKGNINILIKTYETKRFDKSSILKAQSRSPEKQKKKLESKFKFKSQSKKKFKTKHLPKDLRKFDESKGKNVNFIKKYKNSKAKSEYNESIHELHDQLSNISNNLERTKQSKTITEKLENDSVNLRRREIASQDSFWRGLKILHVSESHENSVDIISRFPEDSKSDFLDQKYQFDHANQTKISMGFYKEQLRAINVSSEYVCISTHWIPGEILGKLALRVLTNFLGEGIFRETFHVELLLSLSKMKSQIQKTVLESRINQTKSFHQMTSTRRRELFSREIAKLIRGELIIKDASTKEFFEEHYLVCKRGRYLHFIISPKHWLLRKSLNKVIEVSHLMLVQFESDAQLEPQVTVFNEYDRFLEAKRSSRKLFLQSSKSHQKQLSEQAKSIDLLRDEILAKNVAGIKINISELDRETANLQMQISNNKRDIQNFVDKMDKIIKNQTQVTQDNLEVESPENASRAATQNGSSVGAGQDRSRKSATLELFLRKNFAKL